MTESGAIKPAIVPFLVGDLLLLAVAGGIVYQSPWPLAVGPMALCVAAVALGAWLMVTPFILQHRSELKLAEADKLQSTVAQIRNLEQINTQIAEATDLWQHLRGECANTVNTAKEVAEGMATEAKAFTEFMQKANDSEKATLRLEVDKLRRLERDWVEVLVRTLDHVYALYTAGVSSGQANLIQQFTNFQNACREAARRIGLVPFGAEPGEAFDPNAHQLPDPNLKASPGMPIARTLATGYRYQGQLIRSALVLLEDGTGAGGAATQAQAASAPDSTG